MAEEEGMGSFAITTVTLKHSFHVQPTSFAQVQQAKKRLLQVPMLARCCAQVSCYYDGK